jgi:hypothetical protein
VTTPTAARTLRSVRRSDCTRFGPVVRTVSERVRCISCRLLKRDVTPAVAVFAATDDAVYDLLRPFVLFYVSGTLTVSTVLSSRHRPGNIRLVVNGRSTHDGFVATHRRIVPQSEVGHPTGYPVNKRGETSESPLFELNDGRSNYVLVLTTPPIQRPESDRIANRTVDSPGQTGVPFSGIDSYARRNTAEPSDSSEPSVCRMHHSGREPRRQADCWR